MNSIPVQPPVHCCGLPVLGSVKQQGGLDSDQPKPQCVPSIFLGGLGADHVGLASPGHWGVLEMTYWDQGPEPSSPTMIIQPTVMSRVRYEGMQGVHAMPRSVGSAESQMDPKQHPHASRHLVPGLRSDVHPETVQQKALDQTGSFHCESSISKVRVPVINAHRQYPAPAVDPRGVQCQRAPSHHYRPPSTTQTCRWHTAGTRWASAFTSEGHQLRLLHRGGDQGLGVAGNDKKRC